ncbi:porin family protein [Maricaulis sp.]|uniref:porin family protein n=1 Tax=Maricaulis sp. TaxID=1486257 RepID=UPI003A8E2E06|tara:strand:- start:862 stop:1386 length:525 start_codon:yes stop_codon:yes gene_type:complete
MMRTIIAASLSALAIGSVAQAQDTSYTLGAGYERFSGDGVDLDSVVLRGRYDFNRYFGVEGQANIGVGDDSVTELGVTADVSLDYAVGVFGVVRPFSNEYGNVFLRAGYTNSQIDASVAGFSGSADSDAWAYGIGGEYLFDSRNGVRLDYTNFDYDGGGSSDVYGISYVRRFGG